VGGQIYPLPVEDVDIFKIYALSLYTGKAYSITEDDQDVPDNGRGTWVKRPHDADAPVQFLQDVITGLATAGAEVYEDEVEMPWEEAPCAYYHVHDGSELCRR
jgi:hypothetical protein